MNLVAEYRAGRCALHLICALADHAWRFHFSGICREFHRSLA